MRSGDSSDHVHNGVQDEPIEDGSSDQRVEDGGTAGVRSAESELPTDPKKRGILIQVAADTDGKSSAEIARVLAQRLDEAGLPVEAGEVDALVASLPDIDWQRAAPVMNDPQKAADPEKLTPDRPGSAD